MAMIKMRWWPSMYAMPADYLLKRYLSLHIIYGLISIVADASQLERARPFRASAHAVPAFTSWMLFYARRAGWFSAPMPPQDATGPNAADTLIGLVSPCFYGASSHISEIPRRPHIWCQMASWRGMRGALYNARYKFADMISSLFFVSL